MQYGNKISESLDFDQYDHPVKTYNEHDTDSACSDY